MIEANENDRLLNLARDLSKNKMINPGKSILETPKIIKPDRITLETH